jgi:pSer/pThr/pTyr-binding forkhead associated (FHA) protein
VKKNLTISSSGATQLSQPHLVLADGERCEVHTLKAARITRIGRSEKNDVVVMHEKTSRRHCEIFHRGNRWFIRDLESKNGTRLNRIKVMGEEPLEQGDVIEVACAQIIFTGQQSGNMMELLSGETDLLQGDTDSFQRKELTDPM